MKKSKKKFVFVFALLAIGITLLLILYVTLHISPKVKPHSKEHASPQIATFPHIAFPPIHIRDVSYTLTDLGLGQANAINDLGEVVGVAGSKKIEDDEVQGKAFIWQSGRLQFLGRGNMIASNATSINRDGEVLGVSYVRQTSGIEKYRVHTFLWKDGRMHDLSHAIGTYKVDEIAASNDLITKDMSVNAIAYAYHPKIWKHFPKDVFIDKEMQWDEIEHTAINNQGVIIFSLQASGEEHAGISKHGVIRELTYPPGSWETIVGHKYYDIPNFHAYGINDCDEIVGNSDNANGDAILWAYGKVITLPHLNEDTTRYFAMRADAINNTGDIIGIVTPSLYDSKMAHHAVLWKHGKAEDLNAAIPTNSGWTLEYASAINNRGQIVGYGTYQDKTHAFLLTPLKHAD